VLHGGNVYGHLGQHLGVFWNGFFRDHRGGAVAFMQGTIGGPLLPFPAFPPLPPLPARAPVRVLPKLSPVPALPTLDWGMPWHQFING
jgi:hypothetical protein